MGLMAMDPIVMSAATALVGAMTSEAWQQVRGAVVGWWRHVHPQQADRVDAALEESRHRLAEDTDAERELVATWQARLEALLWEDPTLADGLRRLLEDDIVPRLPEKAAQEFHATASGHGRVFQAGRDMRIHGP